ncbi:hypothetical protein ABZ848_45715 [Streptomyces sp. NPDC047081]|uniref:hypothetical protein n=1 Tax=Streptomyces sp. NPDC047081 TaxID=3154706 RepID=UPI0033C93306
MTESGKLSVGFHQVRSEYVDWGSKSAHPAIRQITDHLSSLMAEARDLVPGPASEVIEDVEETTASAYANETNRVIRFTANCAEGPVEFDLVVQLAARTPFVYAQE